MGTLTGGTPQSQALRLYTCTDRDGVVYRRWRCPEPDALAWALRVSGPWTMLVDSRGRIIATPAQALAVAQARVCLETEYGPLLYVHSIEPGHERADGGGRCPTCGLVAHDGPAFDRDDWIAGRQRVCFESAAWVVDLAYRDRLGRTWRATYGVPAEGPAVCWAS